MYCWPASSDMAYPNTTLFLQAVSPPYQKLLDDHEVGQIEGTIEHTFKVKTLLRRAFSLGSSSFERLEAAFEQKTATVNTKSASNGGKWPGNLKAPKALTDAFEALIGAVLMDFELKIMGSNTAFLVAMVPLAPTLFVVDSSMDGHTPTLTRQSPLLEPWLSFTTVPDKSKAWRTNALVPDGRWRACTGILVVTSLKAFGQTQCFSRSIEAVERLEATNFQPFPTSTPTSIPAATSTAISSNHQYQRHQNQQYQHHQSSIINYQYHRHQYHRHQHQHHHNDVKWAAYAILGSLSSPLSSSVSSSLSSSSLMPPAERLYFIPYPFPPLAHPRYNNTHIITQNFSVPAGRGREGSLVAPLEKPTGRGTGRSDFQEHELAGCHDAFWYAPFSASELGARGLQGCLTQSGWRVHICPKVEVFGRSNRCGCGSEGLILQGHQCVLARRQPSNDWDDEVECLGAKDGRAYKRQSSRGAA
ncbi:hypothetical protein BX616_002847 [Lobosporangium transversale]|nr:hypothetical protein BX616_002847 [Lobosporangium transversale]